LNPGLGAGFTAPVFTSVFGAIFGTFESAADAAHVVIEYKE